MRLERFSERHADDAISLFIDAVLSCKDSYTDRELAAWASGRGWVERLFSSYSLAATDSGKLLGFGSIDDGYIDMLYVDPAKHGHGIGTTILEALEAHSDSSLLWAHSSLSALPFFERNGYKRVSDETVLRSGIAIKRSIVEKERYK